MSWNTSRAFALVVVISLVLSQRTLAIAEADRPSSGGMYCSIPFEGSASGGTLILASTLGRNARFAAIETRPGESAESVAERLTKALNDDPLWIPAPGGKLPPPSGGTLQGLPGTRGEYMLAGTETGLGIPDPPLSLTATWSDGFVLNWENPPGAYDAIWVVVNWTHYQHRSERLLPGTAQRFVIDSNTYPRSWPDMVEDLDIWVIGFRGDIPSNAAAIHVSNVVQEELYGIPFARGIAPNWTAWSADGPGTAKAEMAKRDKLTHSKANRFYNPVKTASAKPYEQVVKTDGEAGGTGGVTRTFLGLTPGHTYKVTIRLNTMAMGAKSPDWSYSFHMACGGAGGKKLTARQMAGLDALPDGEKGAASGRVVQYDAQKTTQGKYEECTKEILLPEGADSITIWVRFTSGRKGDAVATDYVRLEDLGKR